MRKVVLSVALVLAGTPALADDALRERAQSLFGVLPDSMPGSEQDNQAMVELGRQLYMDERLSDNNSQSCNTCHDVTNDGPGVDNETTSPGAFGERGARNAPTVWNAGFQTSQFWDGRAADLVEQAKGPVLNPVEMAMPSEDVVVEKLREVPEYQGKFEEAFGAGEGITYDNIAKAIAAFERTLITEDRFDAWQEGDDSALTSKEKDGLQAFIDSGCTTCHRGPTLGGQMYQKMGLVESYENQSDLGRYEVTGNESDRMVFKVPMLRDVARTEPYFHDGSVESLDEAVRTMGRLQVGRELDDETVSDIVAFLESLTHEG